MKFKSLTASFLAAAFVINAGAQTSDQDLLDEMLATYPFNKVLSFSETKKSYALTALYRSATDKEPLTAAAEVKAEKDGASIYFRVYRTCEPTDLSGRLPTQIIMVSAQKVEAHWVCGKSSGGHTNEVFMVKSEAGKDFVKREFAEKALVFVRLNGVPVPFATGGLGQALSQASGKAL